MLHEDVARLTRKPHLRFVSCGMKSNMPPAAADNKAILQIQPACGIVLLWRVRGWSSHHSGFGGMLPGMWFEDWSRFARLAYNVKAKHLAHINLRINCFCAILVVAGRAIERNLSTSIYHNAIVYCRWIWTSQHECLKIHAQVYSHIAIHHLSSCVAIVPTKQRALR